MWAFVACVSLLASIPVAAQPMAAGEDPLGEVPDGPAPLAGPPLVVIVHHPNDGVDPLGFAAIGDRDAYIARYPVEGALPYPAFTADGVVPIEGLAGDGSLRGTLEAYEAAVAARSLVEAPAALRLAATYLPGNGTVAVVASAAPAGGSDLGTARGYLALVEDHVEARPIVTNGVFDHRFVVRAFHDLGEVRLDEPRTLRAWFPLPQASPDDGGGGSAAGSGQEAGAAPSAGGPGASGDLDSAAAGGAGSRAPASPAPATTAPGWSAVFFLQAGADPLARFAPGEVLQATSAPLDGTAVVQARRGVLVEALSATWCEPCLVGDIALERLAVDAGVAQPSAPGSRWDYLLAPDSWWSVLAALFVAGAAGALAARAWRGRAA